MYRAVDDEENEESGKSIAAAGESRCTYTHAESLQE
jgi:hypothetical protein